MGSDSDSSRSRSRSRSPSSRSGSDSPASARRKSARSSRRSSSSSGSPTSAKGASGDFAASRSLGLSQSQVPGTSSRGVRPAAILQVGDGHAAVLSVFTHSELVCACTADGVVHVWSLSNNRELRSYKRHHTAPCCVVFFGERSFSGSPQELEVHRWGTGSESSHEGPLLAGHTAGVLGLAVADSFLISWSVDCSIRRWKLPDGEPASVLQGHSAPINTVLVRPRSLVSISEDSTVRLWPTDENSAPRVILTGSAGIREAVSLEEHLVCLDEQGTLWCCAWDKIESTQAAVGSDSDDELEGMPLPPAPPHWDSIKHPCGISNPRLMRTHAEHIYLAGPGVLLRLRVHPQWSQKYEMNDPAPLNDMAFHGDHLYTAAGGTGAQWNATTLTCENVFRGHTGNVLGVACTSEKLVTFGDDGCLRVWDLRACEAATARSVTVAKTTSAKERPQTALPSLGGAGGRASPVPNRTASKSAKKLPARPASALMNERDERLNNRLYYASVEHIKEVAATVTKKYLPPRPHSVLSTEEEQQSVQRLYIDRMKEVRERREKLLNKYLSPAARVRLSHTQERESTQRLYSKGIETTRDVMDQLFRKYVVEATPAPMRRADSQVFTRLYCSERSS
eukprot:TRINITY_DN21401_c0_g1_i1.p1 TRINITY_DN21401_c0_g1~~TRINITY_DN21401_c0_g1_i1.p1  ORF type:complete len:631 (-),score=51.04 TRINITY_DN21401_c0_g1_i1:2-1870(-)